MVVTLPLHKNLLYGQYYILLLLIFTASLWLYLHQKRLLAGLVLGIGFGLKIFPLFFLLYFLRKKDSEATTGLLVGSGAVALVSLAAFGLELNRTYLLHVLPWALRGEAADPFNLAANSLSALLHHLFIHEPEWNPHALLHAPAVVAAGRPLLQALIFCPAILLAKPREFRPLQVRLEWSAYIVSLLAISTMPASYHFTLLILPMAIMMAALIEEKRFRVLALLLALYFGICFPFWRSDFDGGMAFLAVPRLYLLIALCLFSYSLLRQKRPLAFQYRRDRWVWAGVLAGGLVFQVATNLHRLHGVYERSEDRLLTSPGVFLTAEPLANRNSTLFISMLSDGYHAGERTHQSVHLSDNEVDRLAVAAREDRIWVEESGKNAELSPLHLT